MARGLIRGFAQGYGLVSDIQDRRAQRELQQKRYQQKQQRYADEKQWRRKQYADQQARYAAKQDWREKKYADQQAYQDEVMGLKRDKFAHRRSRDRAQDRQAAQANAIEARGQDIEMAREQRRAREQQNRRLLEAAGQELEANKATPRFRELAKRGGVNVDKLVDPKWLRAKDTLIAGLEGAPVARKKMIESANMFMSDRVNRVVGSQTRDGREIVRAEIDDILPTEDGKNAMVDFKVWARDSEGNVSEYNAPATSNRSAQDEYVMNVPIDKVIGRIKGMDLLEKSVPKAQLQSLIDQEITLRGGGASEGSGEWKKLNSSQIFDPSSGEYKNIEPVADKGERSSQALDMAFEVWKGQNKDAFSGKLDDVSPEQMEREIRPLQEQFERRLTPENDDAQSVVIPNHPQHGDITEADIEASMQATGKSRREVLQDLRASG